MPTYYTFSYVRSPILESNLPVGHSNQAQAVGRSGRPGNAGNSRAQHRYKFRGAVLPPPYLYQRTNSSANLVRQKRVSLELKPQQPPFTFEPRYGHVPDRGRSRIDRPGKRREIAFTGKRLNRRLHRFRVQFVAYVPRRTA